MNSISRDYSSSIWGPLIFSVLAITAALCVLFFIPSGEPDAKNHTEENLFSEEKDFSDELTLSSFAFEDDEAEVVSREDEALVMYRQSESRAAVEWFYTQITGDREVALAVLESADEYSVSPSLAFALAHTESNYKTNARHVNKNDTIDRGLFQLNSASFPSLTESQFYDAATSAHYGLSHLRFCLNTAGNEIAALAMYNAGTNKVRNNGTPQQTLNYISEIETYRSLLEDAFSREVVAYFNSQMPLYADKLVALH